MSRILFAIFIFMLVTGCTATPNENEKTNTKYLTISGTGVETEINLSLDELKEIPDALFAADFFALNNFGTKAYFTFEGAKLKKILEHAKLKDTATKVKFIAEDGYEKELTIQQALKEDYIDEQNVDAKYPVLIAWKEEGEEYNPEDGAPFRLVLGQEGEGDINKPNWVSNLVKIIVE